MQTKDVQGVPVPSFLYGTAWKEDETERLVAEALRAGFRGIDTANQRRHYHEAGVGAAVRNSLESRTVAREDLFLQTKFTYVESHDHRLPYDPNAPPAEQVRQSFASSLEHLGVDRIDAYLIHGPRARRGLAEDDLEVWRTMEELHGGGAVRLIGISNVTARQLALLCEVARVRPAFVQNRCFARTGWDREVREVCRREGVVYQGFSLLTANVAELRSSPLREIAARHARTVAQVAFRFALQLGMICLTGTTDRDHMREDLEVFGFELSADELATVESISG